MTYNEVASLQDDDIKKIFYAFTWDNNDKYYDLYNNSELGKELLSKMEKNETIKSLFKNNMQEEDIIKFAQISKEDLDEIKKSMGK